MKKTIVVSLALLFTAIFNYSSGMRTGEPLTTGEPDGITTLIINANVNVVLVDNDKATLEVAGENSLAKLVTFTKTGDTLVISSARNRNLKDAGTIFVPAGQLRKIHINREANVSSLYTLQISKLDVIINGICEFDIHTTGELNLIGTKDYTVVEHRREVRLLPAGILKNRKN
jgi:hypothetical protein